MLILHRSLVSGTLDNLWMLPMCLSRAFSSKLDKKVKRQKIYKEIREGAFKDIHDFRKTGGKLYTAKSTLLEKKDSAKFPPFHGISLSGRDVDLQMMFKNKTSLVLLWMRAVGQGMCDDYRHQFQKTTCGRSDTNIIEISVVEGWLYKLLQSYIIKSTKSTVQPASRHDNFLLHFGSSSPFRSQLIENSIVGHSYLVDGDGLIRWRAHAQAEPTELEALRTCTEQLLVESDER